MNELLFLLHAASLLLFLFLGSRFKKPFLFLYIALNTLLANFFVLKQIHLFHLTVPPSDLYAICAMLATTLLIELHGRKEAVTALLFSFLTLILFTSSSLFHLLYQVAFEDQTHSAYEALLLPTPRLLLASLATFAVVQRAELFLFPRLRKRFPFFFSSLVSIVICQILDTALFTIFGLYGIVHSLTHTFAFSLGIKLIAIALTTPFLSFARRRYATEV